MNSIIRKNDIIVKNSDHTIKAAWKKNNTPTPTAEPTPTPTPSSTEDDFFSSLPQELNIIGEEAFSGTALERVTIPESVSRIEIGTFTDCLKLLQIRIPEGCDISVGALPENVIVTTYIVPSAGDVEGDFD